MAFRFNPITAELDLVRNGGSSSSVWVEGSSSITSMTTNNMDSVSNASFDMIKYIISINNKTNNRFRTIELNILNDNGTYKETVSNKIKIGAMNLEVNTVNNAGTMEVQVVNNNAFDLDIEFAKLILIT